MLEKNADGTPISQAGYGIGGMKEYWACLRNPDWQKVMKAWVKRGVERGADGYIANYFYRHNCLCEHCQRDVHDLSAMRGDEALDLICRNAGYRLCFRKVKTPANRLALLHVTPERRPAFNTFHRTLGLFNKEIRVGFARHYGSPDG